MSTSIPQDETNLRSLAEMLWRDKWIILAMTLLFGAGAAIAAFVIPRSYRAVIVLSPASGGQPGALGGAGAGLSSQLGGLASLAGISLRPDNSRAETVAILGSDVLARRFITERNLLPELFHDKWDAAARRWTVADQKEAPTLQQGVRRFKDLISIDESTKTGLVTLSITWRDPRLAMEWANGLAAVTNDYMRERAIRHSERNIAYLKEQAAVTDVAGIRNAVSSIMESELKNAMLAKGADEYALTVIDPAVTPDIPWSPRRVVWLATGLLSGFFLSMLVVFLRNAWRQPTAE